ncbi:MAG: RnfABCDGE type electron transport complex subunit D, partial [Oscillospiraceae bacterium]|nr:RnfABCDGE type electron transport complex subunit D [Oscillospiraceae bacterium]
MPDTVPPLRQTVLSDREVTQWNVGSLLLTLPLLLLGFYYYGGQALRLAVIAAAAAVLIELAAGRVLLRRNTLRDWNAVVIGLWIACMLPAQISPLYAVAGTAFAILVVKLPFGGTQNAPFVPAAAGFAFLSVCFPEAVFRFQSSDIIAPVDERSLASYLLEGGSLFNDRQLAPILLGQTVGPMGTGGILVIAAVLAATLLIRQRRSAALASLGFVATVAALALLFPRSFGSRWGALGMELSSGCLLFAAVYLLPDPAQLPRRWYTRLGYGVLAGVFCVLLRHLGSYEENVCFAILLANATTPLLIRIQDEIHHLRSIRAEK